MAKKIDFILDSMIKAYLSEQNPIGSMLLQDSLNVPASTIRVYFKRLDNDGYISKLHTSGGRIPTIKAMKHYWKHFFANDCKLNVKSSLNLLEVINKNNLFCLVIDDSKTYLIDVVEVSNKYIILDFKDFRVVFEYDSYIYSLFMQFIGYELGDIKTILYRLNLLKLLDLIDTALRYKIKFICGEKIFASIVKLSSFSSLLNTKLLDYFTDNLIYDELFLPEYMGVKLDCTFKENKSKLILAGSIFTDFENILNQLREAV